MLRERRPHDTFPLLSFLTLKVSDVNGDVVECILAVLGFCNERVDEISEVAFILGWFAEFFG